MQRNKNIEFSRQTEHKAYIYMHTRSLLLIGRGCLASLKSVGETSRLDIQAGEQLMSL